MYRRLIHRYWSGPKEMPEAYKEFGRRWEELNPGWEVFDHGEEVIQLWPDLAPVFNHLYERDAGRDGIELHVQVADVVGYALIREFGGVYVNCDMEPLMKNMEQQLPEMAWASYENEEDWRIVNAAIGAPQPQDPFWSGLLDGLPARYFSNPYDEMVMTTGPGYLTDYARARKDNLYVFPKWAFNHTHWKQISVGEDAGGFENHPEAIAKHHWGHKKDQRSNVIETATQHAT